MLYSDGANLAGYPIICLLVRSTSGNMMQINSSKAPAILLPQE